MVAGVNEHLPDLVLMDLSFKDGDGIVLIKSLMDANHRPHVLVISQFDDQPHIQMSMKAGARGYLTKRATTGEILTAIRTILNGEIYAEKPQADGCLLPGEREPVFPTTRTGEPVKLTKREIQVLQLIGAGKRTKDIAIQLNLSHKTVETYREHLKQKLSLTNSAELVHFAICWNERQSNPSDSVWSI